MLYAQILRRTKSVEQSKARTYEEDRVVPIPSVRFGFDFVLVLGRFASLALETRDYTWYTEGRAHPRAHFQCRVLL